MERNYRVKPPRSVIALDYGKKGDPYTRFEHVDKPLAEPSEDGLYDGGKTPVAVETLDVKELK